MSIDKDIWSGLFFMALGALGLYLGADYNFGTTARMGPGFLPKLLCGALIGIGGIVCLIGLVRRTDVMDAWAWGPLVAILCSVLAFGAVLEPLGLEVAVIAAVLIGATAQPAPSRFEMAALVVASLALLVLMVPTPVARLAGTVVPATVAAAGTVLAVLSHARHTAVAILAERLLLAVSLAALSVVVFVDALGLAMKSAFVLAAWQPIKQATFVPLMRILRGIFGF